MTVLNISLLLFIIMILLLLTYVDTVSSLNIVVVLAKINITEHKTSKSHNLDGNFKVK